MQQRSGTFGQDLIRAAQENPIPAALIAMGTLWWFSGGSQTTLAQPVSTAIGAGATLASTTEQGFGRAGAQLVAGKSAMQTISDAGVAAGEGIGETASELAAGAQSAARYAADMAQRRSWALQRDLSDLIERQPLALGAIGICLGAAVASAFPTTAAEEEMFGETSDAVKSQAKTLVTEGLESVQQVGKSIEEMADAKAWE